VPRLARSALRYRGDQRIPVRYRALTSSIATSAWTCSRSVRSDGSITIEVLSAILAISYGVVEKQIVYRTTKPRAELHALSVVVPSPSDGFGRIPFHESSEYLGQGLFRLLGTQPASPA
jgi:hypothetical protein